MIWNKWCMSCVSHSYSACSISLSKKENITWAKNLNKTWYCIICGNWMLCIRTSWPDSISFSTKLNASRSHYYFLLWQENLSQDPPPGFGLQHLWGHGVPRCARRHHLQGQSGLWGGPVKGVARARQIHPQKTLLWICLQEDSAEGGGQSSTRSLICLTRREKDKKKIWKPVI